MEVQKQKSPHASRYTQFSELKIPKENKLKPPQGAKWIATLSKRSKASQSPSNGYGVLGMENQLRPSLCLRILALSRTNILPIFNHIVTDRRRNRENLDAVQALSHT